MAAVSSGVSLSTNYFLNNFYENNRSVSKSSGRSDYTKLELSYEDSRALTRAAKRLLKNDYGSDTDEKDTAISDTTRSALTAFVDTYNNTVDSSKTSTDHDTKYQLKKMKAYLHKYSDELEHIGISMESDGKLKINEDLLKTAKNSKVRKIFSSDQEFSKKFLNLSKKAHSAVESDIYSQINGKGLHVNIAL
ncbi:MAG: hypothetical protein MR954_09125 [Lachnobacterium sp.]|nr:hypothetical protein [Lachnobacterium sp.]MCI7087962.1 hypothetical protein [Lachnobacterium sp.]MCI7531820.1 hypothetical protein [Lachnobacterium sp.]